MSGSILGNFFQGQPVPGQPTGSDTSSNFPLWYQQMLYNTGNAATNLASQDYTPYPGQQVVTPSGPTRSAWDIAQSNVGNYQGALNNAYSLTGAAGAPIGAGSIDPYFQTFSNDVYGAAPGAAYGMNNAALSAGQAGAGALGYSSAGNAGLFNNLLYGNTAGNAGALNQSLNAQTLGMSPAYASSLTGSSLGTGGAYTGAVNSAVQGAIPGYLNPYIGNVIGGIESSLNTNLFNNTLPAIQDKFVSAGQTRSPQEAQLTSEAIYGNQQALGQAVAPALMQGYQTALGAAQSAAGMGYGAGNQFATTGLNAAQGAAGNALSAGQGLASNALTGGINTGTSGYGNAANLVGQGYNLTAGGYQGALNTALSQQQMKQAAGAQYGQLGALTQELGSGDIAQLSQAGQQQDLYGQANLNASMNNFYAQQQWPYQNLAYASNIMRGQQVPSNQMVVGLTQPNQSTYSASPLATGLGTALGASALGGGGGANALYLRKGGHVRRQDPRRRGALSYLREAA